MTPHGPIPPSTRHRIFKAALFTIVSLMLLAFAAQGEAFAVCGDGVLETGEDCDLGGANGAADVCCSTTCGFAFTGTLCRPSAGFCDPAEVCNGVSDSCPIDSFESSTTVCRAAAGVCDVAEQCTGASPACPDDAFAAGSVCRPDVGPCDSRELCDGSSPFCPDDALFPSTTICRSSIGVCDVSENCDGSSPSCPADGFAPAGMVCGFGNDPICDPDELCTGMNPDCPNPVFAPDGTPCFDDGSFCTGVEECMQGMCQGNPPSCIDMNPCTVDFCLDFDEEGQPQGCVNFLTLDNESASGQDGICDTTDDNLPLYGVDQECGTSDDLTGDGFCSAQDNCDFDHNPTQQDSDNDQQGNACDFSPCQTQGLFVTGMNELFFVDPETGELTFVQLSFPASPTDVAVSASGTMLAVSSAMAGTLSISNLNDLSQSAETALASPRGVDIGDITDFIYVVEQSVGRLSRVDSTGNIHPPITTVLSGPAGLDVNAAETFAFVTEPGTGALRRVNITTGAVSTVTSALTTPDGVILDASENNAYVVESSLGRLSRVLLSSGTITVVATGLNNPQGVALDAAGTHAYVTSGNELLQVEISTGNVTSVQIPMEVGSGVALGPEAPPRISLQDGASTASSTVVPLMTDDLTGLGVLSADLTLRFNPDVVTITAVNPGSLTGSCTLTSNLGAPGLAIISIFCTTPLSGAGSLAQLSITATGTTGEGSPLDIPQAFFNEGDPALCADEGTFFIPVEISGTILYYRNHLTGTEPSTKPVDTADVELHNFYFDDPEFNPIPISTVQSDCAGFYSFPNLEPHRPYFVVPRKTNDALGAIDPFDASLNAQAVVGLTTLTGQQRLAADASGNGTLSSFDSARIAQFSVGLIMQLPVATLNGSDWTFIPTPQPEPNQVFLFPFPPGAEQGRIEYSSLGESAENQDFLAILYGDVSGNWTPVCPSALLPGGTNPDAAMMPGPSGGFDSVAPQTAGATGPALLMTSVQGSKGSTVRVPIKARELPTAVSFYMDLRYDPSVVRLLRVESGTATVGRFSLTPNTLETGRARVALFSATPLNGSNSEIAVAVFQVVGAAGTSSRVTMGAWTVNEGRLPASVTEGNIRVLSLVNPPLK